MFLYVCKNILRAFLLGIWLYDIDCIAMMGCFSTQYKIMNNENMLPISGEQTTLNYYVNSIGPMYLMGEKCYKSILFIFHFKYKLGSFVTVLSINCNYYLAIGARGLKKNSQCRVASNPWHPEKPLKYPEIDWTPEKNPESSWN